MFCPSCGSEERQASQYCRACGTDLRPVRVSIERPDSITASAVSAREEIGRSEEHTSELQSLAYLVCRLLLEKKKKNAMIWLMLAIVIKRRDWYARAHVPHVY